MILLLLKENKKVKEQPFIFYVSEKEHTAFGLMNELIYLLY